LNMVNLTAGPKKARPDFVGTNLYGPLLWAGVLLSLILCWSIPTSAGENGLKTTPPEFFQTPADFDSCVKLALRQSPFFTKSALEIEVRRLDEKDSKADYFPSFRGTARYYLTQPNDPNVTDPLNYSFAITTGDYNPLFAHLSLKAKRVVTQIATLAHLKAISLGLDRLAKAFLELNSLENLSKLREQALAFAKENLRFAREQQKLGEITPVEVQIASQEVEVAAAELNGLAASKERVQDAIREFLGLKPGEPLRLDVSKARSQVLGDFQPQKANLQEAQERSFDVRIKKLAQELQSWNVALSKMKFIPSLNVALQSPDPLSLTNVRGTFFSVGLTFPIFEGFKRVRDIQRQKTVLQQFASEETVKADELNQLWREAEEKLDRAAATLRLTQAQVELARLKESQAETLYRTAQKDFGVLMAARQNRIKAQTEAAKAARDYDQAALALRSLSGNLVYHYVNEAQFQK